MNPCVRPCIMSRLWREEGEDGDKITVIGFGFGGPGALYYALSGEMADGAVKAIAIFRGEMDHNITNATVDMMGSSGTTGGGPSYMKLRISVPRGKMRPRHGAK